MASSKEVFHLRKEGRLDEAIHMARSLFQEEPADEWNIRAYGWVLYSLIMQNKESEDVADFINELNNLPEIEDDVFNEKRNVACSMTNPVNQKLQKIIRKSKDGNHSGALSDIRDLRNEHGGSEQIDINYGWELWHGIRMQLYGDDAPNPASIRNMFQEYGYLIIEKPSVLHSRILDIAARTAKKDCFPSFFGFFMWWDQQNIREEDYDSNRKDGKTYASVVEHVIQTLGHVCKKENDQEKLEYASKFIEDNYLQFPDREWFPYYLSLVWNKIDRNSEALELLLPIVRKKSGEYWAWQHLSECYPSGSSERFQCLCKSLTCYVKSPEFLLKVRLELAEELIKSELFNEAKFQIMKIKSVREEHEWGIKGRLEEMLGLEWLTDVEEDEGIEMINRNTQEAEKLLIEGLPTLKGVIAVSEIELGTKKRKFSIIDYIDDFKKINSIPVNHHRFPDVRNYQKGDPIEIIIDESEDRPNVLGINDRSGNKWDINPLSIGILYQINDKKHLSMVKFTDGEKAFLYHNETENASSLKVGDFVQCKISKDRKRTKVRVINKHNENIESDYWKEFEGDFIEKEGGGGHVGTIFIPAYLSKGINQSDCIKGIAIKKKGDFRSRDWWAAISVSLKK